MFRKILVPVDLTDRHTAALKAAAALAGLGGAEITVIHVIELIHGLPREEEGTFYERLERKAKIHLERMLEILKENGPPSRTQVLFGERIPELLRFAAQEGTDLIVLSSHPADPSRPGAGFGTMSHLVGVAASCPVLLVK